MPGGTGSFKVAAATDVIFSGPQVGDIFAVQGVNGTTGAPTFTNIRGLGLKSVPRTSGAYTASNSEFVLANAGGGTITVTLPAASDGAQVRVIKTDTSTNAVTVKPASGTLANVAGPSGSTA